MNKKIIFYIFFILLLLIFMGNVFGAENNSSKNCSSDKYNNINDNMINRNIKNNNCIHDNYNVNKKVITDNKLIKTNITSKNSKIYTMKRNKIKKIYFSKAILKAGTKIKIKILTDNSVKKVLASVTGNYNFKSIKFSKKYGLWEYTLKTNGFKTGKYKINIKAIAKYNQIFKSSKMFTIDNTVPKISLLRSNQSTIIAGNKFRIGLIGDNSTKKVIAKVRGKAFYFKHLSGINWASNIKLSYKEIGILSINVLVYNSLGNVNKKKISVKSMPKTIVWNGYLLKSTPKSVYYSNPTNNYQKSVNILGKYANVYEGFTGDIYVLGITSLKYNSKPNVIIGYKDPFVVYHELAHVLNIGKTEYACDYYAYKKTGYWII